MALDAGSYDAAEPCSLAIPWRNPRRQLLAASCSTKSSQKISHSKTKPMTKKRLQKVMADVYAKYGQEKTAEIADELKDLGFHYATMSGSQYGYGRL